MAKKIACENDVLTNAGVPLGKLLAQGACIADIPLKPKKNSDWVLKQFEDPDFVRLYNHEGFIEDFLMRIYEEMKLKKIRRRKMASHMGRSTIYLSEIFKRTRPLDTKTMVDMAGAVGLNISITFTEE
jgi:hypothetical protein